MKNLNCLDGIILTDLAVHIDISNINSWDLNSGLTLISLSKWKNAKSDDIFLYDFGLTAYDNGRVNSMLDTLTLNANDTKLKLYRVGYNTETGGTFYDGYEIIAITGETGTTGNTLPFVGNYFITTGGFLQGFFKLKDYNFDILPHRYVNGITIETIVKITEESYQNNGYIFLIGARSEDKYLPEYSGESKLINGQFEGITTSKEHFLNSFIEKEEQRNAIIGNSIFETVEVENSPDELYDNIFGIQFLSDGRLAYNYIDSNGIFKSQESEKQIISTGWTIISLTFNPYTSIDDPDLLDCLPNRKGNIIIYVNGRPFWKIENFEEFWMKPFDNHGEKQIGESFNISWGGGSFGLKHSWHWDYKTYPIYINEPQSYVDSAFTETYIPSNNPCITNASLESGFTPTLIISADTKSFVEQDACKPDVYYVKPVLSIKETGTTATTKSSYLVRYTIPLELISNREYDFSMDVYDKDIFSYLSTSGDVRFYFESDVDVFIVKETGYTNTLVNQWQTIRTIIKIQDNTAKQKVKMGILIESDHSLNQNFELFIDNIKYVGQDILKQDKTKLGMKVEKYFSESFHGGIQKLRIYDNALTNAEILHNAIYESKSNKGYDLKITKGGRIING